MDTVYQIIVFNAFYPYEALIIALLLAFVPYLLIRGVTSRISRWYRAYAQNFANTVEEVIINATGMSHDSRRPRSPKV